MAVGAASKTDLGEMLSRLRVMAQGRETLDVAQLHFVELGDIQRAYGDRWTEQKTKIQDSAENFLKSRIGDSDLLIRGDGGFLLVLGSAAGPDAHAAAAQLTHGLNAFFVGSSEHSPAPLFGSAVQAMPARDLESSFGDIDAIASSDSAGAADVGLPGVEWKFEPVWDVKRETLSHWYAAPYLKANGVRHPGYQFENANVQSTQFVKLDEASLWIAEQALQDLFIAGRKTLIGSTVHIRTLTSLASRARILATIDRLNPELHKFRILKIAGVAPGFPRMYLNEVVGALKVRLPNIVIGAAWDEPDLAGLLHSGPIAIGFTIPTSAVGNGPVTAIPALMTRVAEAVKSAHGGRARFLVEGGVTKYLALKFAAIGVDNITSQRIWPARAAAEGMVPWPAGRLAA